MTDVIIKGNAVIKALNYKFRYFTLFFSLPKLESEYGCQAAQDFPTHIAKKDINIQALPMGSFK